MTSDSISPPQHASDIDEDYRRLDPAILFRAGESDAWAVLGAWYVRKLAIPLLWVGLIIAIVADPRHVADISLNSAGDTWHALRSPLAGIVIALAIRVGANFSALLLALPVSDAVEGPQERGSSVGRRIGALGDRMYVASAFRSLRWTLSARRYAIESLGPRGGVFTLLDRSFVVANILLPIAAIVVSVILDG